jgi:hypothetical protein
MKKRQPSRPGLSYLDANAGRLVTHESDVLGIKEQIESRWKGVLEVYFDTHQEEWVIVEHCRDGIDRHVLSTKRLGQWVIDKLERIDQAVHSQDIAALDHKYDLEDRQAEKEHEHRITEATGEGAEKLYFALRKDGVINRPSVFFSSEKAA